MKRGDDLAWALLAPVPPRRLTALIDEYWRAEVDDDEEAPEEEGWRGEEGWEVVGGIDDYSAVLDRNPGSEMTHDEPLAERISRKVKRPVYVLYLHEDYAQAEPVLVYKNGRLRDALPGPYAHARSLGITLPGDRSDEEEEAAADEGPPPVTGLLVVEGVSAADVARALKMRMPPPSPLHIEDGPAGAILYNEENGRAPTFSTPLSKAFPENNVYVVSTGPDRGRLIAWVMRGGKDVGIFDYPIPSALGMWPVLDSVKGEKEPRAIAAALGIPQTLLSVD